MAQAVRDRENRSGTVVPAKPEIMAADGADGGVTRLALSRDVAILDPACAGMTASRIPHPVLPPIRDRLLRPG
jgi:hypothetical protein